MEAQPRGATVIYMCVDAHNYSSGRRVLQYKNGQYIYILLELRC